MFDWPSSSLLSKKCIVILKNSIKIFKKLLTKRNNSFRENKKMMMHYFLGFLILFVEYNKEMGTFLTLDKSEKNPKLQKK